ncbi:MAG: hypothetical protein KBF63_14555 [Rhodoferax sp.]|jgi:hypothetical protein|nr:hypothetical protein [Rhodoferax sp.]MBP9930499.1 hypothetical protein [Rhodoferax sp.]HQX61055.1 hypothetical protein [Burkholderiaceae bacterium]
MTLCPIAIVAGCQKCPAFRICPLKTVIGDAPANGDRKSSPASGTSANGKAARKKR